MASQDTRYHSVAIALHWIMALALVAMLLLGFFMEDISPQPLRVAAYQFHKSLGLLVLLLSVVRLAWRVAHPAPAHPEGMKRWERIAADAGHALLYLVMVLLPLSGWLMISSGKVKYPTQFFGLFDVPLIPVQEATRKMTRALAGEAHELLALGAVALIVLHVLAALKHQYIARDGLMLRMMPRCGRAGCR